MDTLTLDYKHRPGELFEGGLSKAERKYVDFIVSGQSLGERVGAFMADRVGIFGWIPDKWYENDRIDEFLSLIPPELTTGRTSF